MSLKIYLNCILFTLFFSFSSCDLIELNRKENLARAEELQGNIYEYYFEEETNLLRETYPFENHSLSGASISFKEEHSKNRNEYAYLWPSSGVLSAVIALYEATGSRDYKRTIENDFLEGLELYFDKERIPQAYSSYVQTIRQADRYYDDNIWLGINFTDLFALTKEKRYLEKAELLWKFVESGMDDQLGGGVFWCEQKKETKNTCSNAPASVFALKIFELTGDSCYFIQGRQLYEWTKRNLQDTTDMLYFDRIYLDGMVSKQKHSYNSGQMMQASALLYKLTNEKKYRDDSEVLAKACHNYFFSTYSNGKDCFRLLRNGDNWFYAVMLRGYLELYDITKNDVYLADIQKSLDYVWTESRDKDGLFKDRQFGGVASGNYTKWLLTQAAMVEMYARLSIVN